MTISTPSNAFFIDSNSKSTVLNPVKLPRTLRKDASSGKSVSSLVKIASLQRPRGKVEPEKRSRSAVVDWIVATLVSGEPLMILSRISMFCMRSASDLLLRS